MFDHNKLLDNFLWPGETFILFGNLAFRQQFLTQKQLPIIH